MDKDIRSVLLKSLKQQGIQFILNTKIEKIEKANSKVIVTTEKNSPFEVEKVLIAVGRHPFTKNLNLSNIGVSMDEKGFIVTKEGQTSVASIYAIGDVTAGPMLAHKAEEEGVAVAEKIAGQKFSLSYDLIPSVVYTSPEAASIGLTEDQVDSAAVNIGLFPFMANSRARAIGCTEGFVKIIADKRTDKVLGVHIVGHEAGTLIGEAVVAMEYHASSEDIARICHAHPTLNEAIKEASLSTLKRPIHM
jgi:dihydrolipoamide dehydrogenase